MNNKKCAWCGIERDSVASAGMWICPNFACLSPGAAHFRERLDSYDERGPDLRHNVDFLEYAHRALTYAKRIRATDTELADHIVESAKKLLDCYV